jgi:tRNA U34 5-methylaminomethyl-2-thiouridine-forming methyltransferase MnmC
VTGSADYQLVRVGDGEHSVRSVRHGETMHPGLGPVAEARALYVEQLRLVERLQGHRGEYVIWDVGLGAAANVLTVLRALRGLRFPIHVISFDHTLEPLRFAYGHRAALTYFEGYEATVEQLLAEQATLIGQGPEAVRWLVHVTDFPSLLGQPAAHALPKPHAVLFDPWSPAKNPAMWTAAVFANLYSLLDGTRPCVLPTYSRSTLLRVSLLLAGFWVGAGRATGRKEETTVAANHKEWIESPLDGRWLARAEGSSSAEPLWEAVYRQAPLAPATRDKLRQHPQFQPIPGLAPGLGAG